MGLSFGLLFLPRTIGSLGRGASGEIAAFRGLVKMLIRGMADKRKNHA
jgi:hypothetical protein